MKPVSEVGTSTVGYYNINRKQKVLTLTKRGDVYEIFSVNHIKMFSIWRVE